MEVLEGEIAEAALLELRGQRLCVAESKLNPGHYWWNASGREFGSDFPTVYFKAEIIDSLPLYTRRFKAWGTELVRV